MLYHHLTPEERGLILELRNRGQFSSSASGSRSRDRAVPVWTEEDLVKGTITKTISTVLRTTGCSWSLKSNCSMCGYFVDSRTSVDIVEQFRSVIDRAEDQRFLKIYTSGSFLDPGEVPQEIQEEVLRMATDRFDRVLIESRPEFIVPDRLRILQDIVDLEIAIGLESANDSVLLHSLNKGFTHGDYQKAANILSEHEIPLRTYLILKPPFMTEGDAIRDVVSSIRAVEEVSTCISVNPMNVQRFTLVEHLFNRGAYQPPSIWSLIEVLKTETSARLMSSPSGGGTRRGIHNCGTCDKPMLEKIRTFSLSQNRADLEHTCTCRKEWEDRIILEDAIQAPLP